MADIKIYGTLVRDDSTNVDKIVQGSQVEGGFFVCKELPSSGSWIEGQLCYCTGTITSPINEFYQYNGLTWEEAKLGTSISEGANIDITEDGQISLKDEITLTKIQATDITLGDKTVLTAKINPISGAYGSEEEPLNQIIVENVTIPAGFGTFNGNLSGRATSAGHADSADSAGSSTYSSYLGTDSAYYSYTTLNTAFNNLNTTLDGKLDKATGGTISAPVTIQGGLTVQHEGGINSIYINTGKGISISSPYHLALDSDVGVTIIASTIFSADSEKLTLGESTTYIGSKTLENYILSVAGTSGGAGTEGLNYYHTTGDWDGFTYTAEAHGGAGELSFTIPVGTTSSTVAKGNHTHSTYVTSSTLNSKLSSYATTSWVTNNFVQKCLLEGTKITMADGTKKSIEEVQEGDLVKSINLETGEETQAVVLSNSIGDVQNFYYMMVFEDGSSLKTNWTHDIYNATKGTWVKSDCEIYLDDEVVKENGSQVKFIGTIDTIGTINGKRCNFYDIVVSNNCYYADGILCASNPIVQLRWLIPALNKNADKIPQNLRDLIASYRDEDTREADLVHNNAYMAEYIPQMTIRMKKEARLRQLQAELSKTDYVSIKASEGVEITPEMQEVIEARAWWRKLYNEAEVELNAAYKAIDELKVKHSPLGEDILLDNISLRKKFFLESCRKANANLNEFKEYYLYLQELKKQEEEKLNKK